MTPRRPTDPFPNGRGVIVVAGADLALQPWDGRAGIVVGKTRDGLYEVAAPHTPADKPLLCAARNLREAGK